MTTQKKSFSYTFSAAISILTFVILVIEITSEAYPAYGSSNNNSSSLNGSASIINNNYKNNQNYKYLILDFYKPLFHNQHI